MASETNLTNCDSPLGKDVNDFQEAESTCFEQILQTVESGDLEFLNSSNKNHNVSFKDIDRMSLPPLELSSIDLLGRETLGILPPSLLARDSLTTGRSSKHIRDLLDASTHSPRDSLGILNISLIDCGRESIEIFNAHNSFLGRKSLGTYIAGNISFDLDNINFNNSESGLKTQFKETTLPELVLSTSTTQDKITSLSGLNNAFLLPHSRLPSVASNGSSNFSLNPYFNSRSLEEPSKISSTFSHKDLEISQPVMVTTDPFNEAFQLSVGNNNLHSVSQILPSNRKVSLNDEMESIRSRIQSLPVMLEDNNILAHIAIETRLSNVSFPNDALACRGMEDGKEFDDSVFIEAKKVASIIADTSFNSDEKSLDSKEHYILDSTPQPEWPDPDLDSSQNNSVEKDKARPNTEDVLKQVDKLLGMQPVNLEEKLKIKTDAKNASTSLDNISGNLSKISRNSQGSNVENNPSYSNPNFSQNMSRISRTSPEGLGANRTCGSNNFSQNISRITQTSEENVSRLIQNLSDILKENEVLSQDQKNEGRHMLHCLASMLCGNKNKSTSSAEDSGHSSVDDQHLKESKCAIDGDKNRLKIEEATNNDSEELCHALDLSCRNKNCSTEINKRLSMSKSPALSLIKTPNRVTAITNASIASNDSNKNTSKVNNSNASNCSNASVRSSNLSTASRHSNISQNRVSLGVGKLKKAKVGVAPLKKGPLRAILPVENMAKDSKDHAKASENPVTPERTVRLGLASKRTSTPVQEPKLKPMAASTPATRHSSDLKERAVSSLVKTKYNRSVSHQPRMSNTLEPPANSHKTKENHPASNRHLNKSQSDVDNAKLRRRNSVTEGTLGLQKNYEGPMRLKRSFSSGKEPKIVSALNRVRQNILNSPYYHPKKGPGSQNEALTENVRKSGVAVPDLRGCGEELKRLSVISQPKKIGKENLKP